MSGIGVNVIFVSKNVRPEIFNDNIKYINGTISEVVGNNKVEAVMLGKEKIMADAVFMLRDAVAPTALVEGLKTEGNFIAVNRNLETNIEGLYATGDITGKPLQLSKAVSEGLIAAQHAASQIDKTEK